MAVTQVKSKQQFLVTDDVNFQTKKITNLADPVSAQDAATKAYVDAVKQALDIKDSVRVATTANITLSGTQTIDGVSVIAGNRVLVKDQSTGSANGIYVVAAGAWARSADADISAEVTSGLFVFVEEGTANGDSGYVLTTNAPITLDTTALTFTQFSGAGQITAGAGLTKTGNQIDAVGTASRIVVNADSIDIASDYVGQTSIITLGTVTTGTWSANTILANRGGTGFSSYTVGDILYADTASTLNKIAAVATGNALISGGTSTAPSWGKIGLTTHISGTLAVGNGGTGATSLTGVLFGNGSSAFTAVSSVTALQVLRVNAGGNGYEFATVAFGGGSVTSVSVVSANGFAGTVATASTTPAITLTTTQTGVLIGDGTSMTGVAGTANQLLRRNAGNTAYEFFTPVYLTSTNKVTREIPSGTINGSNVTFTLANTPTAGTEHVFVNGVLMNAGAGNDYTISSATITFLTGAVPQTGDVVLVSYLK